MTPYIAGGLVTGSILAILALGLTLTHVATRIFNIGHGAIAFFVAMCFYQMNSVHHWPIWVAGVLSVLGIAPGVGVLLWAILFRQLSDRPATVKLVATIGVFVALPAVALFAFGNDLILSAPGLGGNPPSVHSVAGVRLNENQILAVVAAAVVAVTIPVLLHFTRFGLMVRSVVDAPTVSELSGIASTRVSVAVWAIGSTLAGLSGVLLAPLVGLDATQFGLYLVASFAAVVVARFRSLLVAFSAAIFIGVAQSLTVKYLPTAGTFTASTIEASIPFVVIFVVLIVFQLLRLEWGALDSTLFTTASAGLLRRRVGSRRRFASWGLGVVLIVLVIAAVPALFTGYWVAIFAAGTALGIVMLSFVLVSGEGGMISLCQISVAGLGAGMLGQFTFVSHWPFALAMVGAAVVGACVALVLGIVLTGLNNLYFALATLAFGLLVENIVFTRQRFYQDGGGVPVTVPNFLLNPTHLFVTYACIFVVAGLGLRLAQHSLPGLVLAGMRSSPSATSSLGVNVVFTRLATFVVGGALAGLGGAMLAGYSGLAFPASQFPTLTGLLWLAVLATFGTRSVLAALLAGVALEVMPQLLTEHLSPRWLEVVPVLFGLGAIGLAKDPRGLVAQLGQFFRSAGGRLGQRRLAPVLEPDERQVARGQN